MARVHSACRICLRGANSISIQVHSISPRSCIKHGQFRSWFFFEFRILHHICLILRHRWNEYICHCLYFLRLIKVELINISVSLICSLALFLLRFALDYPTWLKHVLTKDTISSLVLFANFILRLSDLIIWRELWLRIVKKTLKILWACIARLAYRHERYFILLSMLFDHTCYGFSFLGLN